MEKSKEKKHLNKDTETNDPFFGVKYIGWCRSQLPPDDVSISVEDFLQHVRHFLSVKKQILFKDPVFDTYTEEDLLTEYFAIRFDEDSDFRGAFEAQMRGISQDVYDWFEEEEQKYLEAREKEAKELMGGKDEIEDVF